MAVTHVFSNAVPDATGTLTVWYGATTATVAATDIVRPSNWNEAHAQIVTLGGNTAGVSVVTGTNIVFGGSNNVTLSGIQGANAATINFSAAAGGGGGSVNVSAGTTSNNLTNFVFADGNGVSFGLNGSTITATVRTNQAGTGFTSTTTAGTAVAATLSTNGLSMAVPQFLTTAQPVGAYLTTARASNDAVGLNTAQSNVTWTVNSSGLSLDARGYAGTATGATNASVTVNSGGVSVSVGNYITTARASTDAIGLNTAQSNVTWTVNSSGLSLDARGYAGTNTGATGASVTANSNGVSVSVTQSNQAVSANNGSYAFQTLSFSNANGISFGTSAGSAITASHNALTTARASNDGIGLNTAQTNVTWTVNSAGLSLNAAGYAGTGTTFNGANVSGSMTVNSNGVNLSLSAGAGGGGTNLTAYANSNTTQSSSGTIALSSLNFAGAGIASVGITNGSVLISVPSGGGAGDGGVSAGVSNLGNTLGDTGIQTAGNFVLVGSNGVTLSQSTAGGNATVTIQGAPPRSRFVFQTANGIFNTFNNNSNSFICPFDVDAPITFDYMRMVGSAITNSSSAATSINTTFTGSVVTTFAAGLWVRMTGASSNSFSRIAYTTQGSTQLVSLQANSTGSQYSVTFAATFPFKAGTQTFSTTYATSQTRFDFSSNSLTGLTGLRMFDLPLGSSLSPGNYFIMTGRSTSAATQGNAAATNLRVTYLPLHNTAQQMGTVANVGSATNSSVHWFTGMGGFSSTATATILAQSNITITGSVPFLAFQLVKDPT